MFNSILVVCVGNICRSPTAERMLRKAFPGKKIASAGLAALVGFEADEMARIVALENGIDLSKHQARQLSVELCHEFDLILVMEKNFIEEINKLAPEARGKIMIYGHWMNDLNILDPYKKSREAYDYVFYLLSSATKEWVRVLSSE